MSLHALANHMASRGRNGDSMLVHMTPGEVHGLQALALKHGGSLTINPETGLVEAGFLSKLLPMIAGFALNAFLPGIGLGISSALGITGASAGAIGTGIAVGGATGLATGSLEKGFSAGLGALGGAGIGNALMGAGASSVANAGVEGLGPTGQANLMATPEQIANVRATATPASLMSEGFKSATANPTDFLKDNWKYGAAALAPLAGGIDTATPLQKPAVTGSIAQKIYDPYTQTYTEMNPVNVADWQSKNMQFSDVYKQPMQAKSGGIVALNHGGMAHFADGGYNPQQIQDAIASSRAAGYSDADIMKGAQANFGTDVSSYFKTPAAPAFDQAAQDRLQAQFAPLNANAAQQQAATAAGNSYNQNTTAGGLNLADRFAQVSSGTPIFDQAAQDKLAAQFAPANAVAAQEQANTFDPNKTVNGLTLEQRFAPANALAAQEQAATFKRQQQADADAASAILAAQNAPAYQAKLDAEEKARPAGLASIQTASGTQGSASTSGLAGTTAAQATGSQAYQTATNTGGIGATGLDKNIAAYMNNLAQYYSEDPTRTVATAEAKIRKDMLQNGVSDADVLRATGKTVQQILNPITTVTGPVVVPSIAKTQADTFSSNPTLTGQAAAQPGIAGGVSGTAGAGQIGGGTVRNQDTGMIVESPRIPGIPVGGFTGAKNMRDVYTQGGGSLGYTSPVPASYQALLDKYAMSSGSDSEAMDKYLRGKGPYPYKSSAASIQAPYSEATLGMPAASNRQYIWDKASGKTIKNMDYAPPIRDAKTGDVTYGLSANEATSYLNDLVDNKKPLQGQDLYDWAKANKVDAQTVADAYKIPVKEINSQWSNFRRTSAASSSAKTTGDFAMIGDAKTGDTVNLDQTYDQISGNNITITGIKQADGTFLGSNGKKYDKDGKPMAAAGGMMGYAVGGLGSLGSLGGYSDGGQLLRGPGNGVSDDIPAVIGDKQPARLADGEFVVPARIVSELGNGSTDAGARSLYKMMDRIQHNRRKSIGKGKVAADSRSEQYLPA